MQAINRLSKKKIDILVYVIEDDLDDQWLVKEFLEESIVYNCFIEIMESIEEAEYMIAKQKPDIILLDLSLSDGQGLEGLKVLMNAWPDLNIIILPGYCSEKIARDAVNIGAADYLIKGKVDSYLLSKTIGFSLERRELNSKLAPLQGAEEEAKFAAKVSHKFMNQLTILTVLLMNGKRTFKDKSFSSFIDRVDQVKERCLRLTKQILTFDPSYGLRPDVMNLNDLIEKNREVLISLLGEKIIFNLIKERELKVFFDPAELEDILLNLVINAKDATKEKGKVFVSCYKVKSNEAEELACIEVRDTGNGIDEKTKSKIFDPFFTTKDKGEGTGLGLSTIREAVLRYGGEIHVESQLGEGSIFKVFLKLA